MYHDIPLGLDTNIHMVDIEVLGMNIQSPHPNTLLALVALKYVVFGV
jgi:hypothetical protein